MSWFSRLKTGLSKSSTKITSGITGIFTRQKLDQEALDDLEDLLITSDIGPALASQLTGTLAKDRFEKNITDQEVRAHLADQITTILTPIAIPLDLANSDHRPRILLMVGVNGSGKTTTIGKLAQSYKEQGLSVMLAAGDTFRAAAVEQLSVWGDRTGCPVIKKETGADAAALAFEAIERAKADNVDLLMIDTAGRLQNKKDLMAELEKVIRVIRKKDDTAPHDTILVLDATTGQNAHSQVETFKNSVDISGLIVTKLDGTAKGGVLVSLAQKFALPVHAIGVGEKADDLRPFKAQDFANSLMGLDQN